MEQALIQWYQPGPSSGNPGRKTNFDSSLTLASRSAAVNRNTRQLASLGQANINFINYAPLYYDIRLARTFDYGA